MHINYQPQLDFCDVLLDAGASRLKSRKDVDIEREFKFYYSSRIWKGVPIMAANMDTTGTFEMAKTLSKHKMITVLHKHYSLDELTEFFETFKEPDFISYSMGINPKDFIKFKQILDRGLGDKFNLICLDVPNAYLEHVVDKFARIRKLCPDHIIMAGNVISEAQTSKLIEKSYADIVKVGIGSGSACTTRRQTGVGKPQFSAVVECANAAHHLDVASKRYGLIISDGGIVDIGDISKAYAGGADFVMMGSKFAGFKQSGGKTIEIEGKLYKEFYGMSSEKAMNKHSGGMAKHRSSEGRELLIPFKGDVEDFIQEIKGGIRSTGTYIGAKSLKEFNKRANIGVVYRTLNRSLEQYDTKN